MAHKFEQNVKYPYMFEYLGFSRLKIFIKMAINVLYTKHQNSYNKIFLFCKFSHGDKNLFQGLSTPITLTPPTIWKSIQVNVAKIYIYGTVDNLYW